MKKSKVSLEVVAAEPTPAAQSPITPTILDKKGYGVRWHFGPRHIDNLIAQGLPHYKVGKRRVRISVPEADAWMKEQFGTQRRAHATKTANGHAAGGIQ